MYSFTWLLCACFSLGPSDFYPQIFAFLRKEMTAFSSLNPDSAFPDSLSLRQSAVSGFWHPVSEMHLICVTVFALTSSEELLFLCLKLVWLRWNLPFQIYILTRVPLDKDRKHPLAVETSWVWERGGGAHERREESQENGEWRQEQKEGGILKNSAQKN